ncbi:hypothetical protein UQ64_26995 [Paenibacillus etheri]|uniref:Uncharacterized protein n=1 Tax=Paenibacillus etheri TaxID=1306852 RepID=A0A0W1ARF0_9BACL|nr:hypothetical protein UQ64_26995 [Paenibacillus etheri]
MDNSDEKKVDESGLYVQLRVAFDDEETTDLEPEHYDTLQFVQWKTPFSLHKKSSNALCAIKLPEMCYKWSFFID